MLVIYSEDAAARQLILAQHGLTEVTQADRQHDIELGNLMHKLFIRHFELPTLPTDVDVFALAMELGDRVYARSMQLHEQITPRMAEEGMRVFDAPRSKSCKLRTARHRGWSRGASPAGSAGSRRPHSAGSHGCPRTPRRAPASASEW